jgi:SsrA-binding protein
VNEPDQTIAQNRKARHEYTIGESFEAGIVLTGTEIKSVRARHVNLAQAYVRIESGEAWLVGANIALWDSAAGDNHDPARRRKLLLHTSQIEELEAKTRAKGLTVIALKMYLTRGRAKVEIGVGRGKAVGDKRRDIAERDSRRETDRAIADAVRGRTVRR